MITLNKRTYLALLFVALFFTPCNGQIKTELPKASVALSKLTHRSKNFGDNIHGSLQDRRGNLWFVATGDGAYRYDGKAFTNFTITDGLKSNCVLSILEDRNGVIWFGTAKGITRFDGESFRQIPFRFSNESSSHPLSASNDDVSTEVFVFTILEDKVGKLWFATNKGVYIYNGESFSGFASSQSVVTRNGLSLNNVNRMLEDIHGNIWFTTKTEGVCRYDGTSLVSFKPSEEAYFWGLLEDKKGNIWVGGREKGLWRYDGEEFLNVAQNGKFDSYLALSIIEDRTGNIWFGTEGGIWRYDGKAFVNFPMIDSFGNDDVWSLLEDNAGNLWVGTRNTGLSRFDGKTFVGFAK